MAVSYVVVLNALLSLVVITVLIALHFQLIKGELPKKIAILAVAICLGGLAAPLFEQLAVEGNLSPFKVKAGGGSAIFIISLLFLSWRHKLIGSKEPSVTLVTTGDKSPAINSKSKVTVKYQG